MTKTVPLKGISPRTVGRLSLYRRVLQGLRVRRVPTVYSRELALLAGVTASLVRQDLRGLGYQGNTQLGYEVVELDRALARRLGGSQLLNVVLLGVGYLGRAVLLFFQRHHPHLNLAAALEADPQLVGRRIQGIPVIAVEQLEETVTGTGARVAILAVPASEAQVLTDRLVSVGVRSILNFTTQRLRVPAGTYVENNDISLSLERVAFYGFGAEEAKR